MSYHLSCTEDDTKVKKAVDEAQGIYDVHGKREWVKWAGKTLMPHMHVQIVMEKADEMRAEQDVMDEERLQAERAERKQERAAKEAELEEKEDEYIKQLNTKEIDEDWFRELIGELDWRGRWVRALRRVRPRRRQLHRTRTSGRVSGRCRRRKNQWWQ
jgi:hypothetical protein